MGFFVFAFNGGGSSVGRAMPLHGIGREFESRSLHHSNKTTKFSIKATKFDE